MFDDMDLVDDLECNDEPDSILVFETVSEENLVPKIGNFLGLDISQNSSGICLYKNGKKYVYNSSVVYDPNNPHAEAYMRYQLKQDLLEVIGDTELDLIVIEDVFEGYNAEVVRKLYALNTAIDDLILEGKVTCKEFVRVSNGTWKSWLSVVDTKGIYKGYKDKEKVRGILGILGVSEEGDGYQDRLDATGMLLGYFLRGKNEKPIVKSKVRVSFNDLEFMYELDADLISSEAFADREDIGIMRIPDTIFSKKKILEYVNENYFYVYITSEPVRLGLLAETLNLPLLDGKGYFGFWVCRNVNKYRKLAERLEESV